MALDENNDVCPEGSEADAPRKHRGRRVAAVVACVVIAVALVCAALVVGTLYGPSFVRTYMPSLADDLDIMVEPEPELERLDDGYDGELARRIAAVSAELVRSAYDVPDLDEATADALQGLLEAADPYALYLDRLAYEAYSSGTYAQDAVELSLVGTVGVITVTNLNAGVSDELAEAIEEARDAGATSFVLDLRSDPGGSFNEAVAVASLFLNGGTVAEQIDADGTTTRVSVTPGAGSVDEAVVVLVSPQTGGSAELVAAALQDHRRAPILGETTAGRGMVQTLKTLSFGGAVIYATSEFLTPDGNTVEGVGITPDIIVGDELPDGISDELAEQVDDLALLVALGALAAWEDADDITAAYAIDQDDLIEVLESILVDEQGQEGDEAAPDEDGTAVDLEEDTVEEINEADGTVETDETDVSDEADEADISDELGMTDEPRV